MKTTTIILLFLVFFFTLVATNPISPLLLASLTGKRVLPIPRESTNDTEITTESEPIEPPVSVFVETDKASDPKKDVAKRQINENKGQFQQIPPETICRLAGQCG